MFFDHKKMPISSAFSASLILTSLILVSSVPSYATTPTHEIAKFVDVDVHLDAQSDPLFDSPSHSEISNDSLDLGSNSDGYNSDDDDLVDGDRVPSRARSASPRQNSRIHRVSTEKDLSQGATVPIAQFIPAPNQGDLSGIEGFESAPHTPPAYTHSETREKAADRLKMALLLGRLDQAQAIIKGAVTPPPACSWFKRAGNWISSWFKASPAKVLETTGGALGQTNLTDAVKAVHGVNSENIPEGERASRYDVVMAMLDAGVNIHARNRNGNNAFDFLVGQFVMDAETSFEAPGIQKRVNYDVKDTHDFRKLEGRYKNKADMISAIWNQSRAAEKAGNIQEQKRLEKSIHDFKQANVGDEVALLNAYKTLKKSERIESQSLSPNESTFTQLNPKERLETAKLLMEFIKRGAKPSEGKFENVRASLLDAAKRDKSYATFQSFLLERDHKTIQKAASGDADYLKKAAQPGIGARMKAFFTGKKAPNPVASVTDDYGNTALQHAVVHGNYEAAKVLVQHDVSGKNNAPDPDENPGKMPSVKTLLLGRAKTHPAEAANAVELAILRGTPQLASEILEKHGPISLADTGFQKALETAVKHPYADGTNPLAEALILKGVGISNPVLGMAARNEFKPSHQFVKDLVYSERAMQDPHVFKLVKARSLKSEVLRNELHEELKDSISGEMLSSIAPYAAVGALNTLPEEGEETALELAIRLADQSHQRADGIHVTQADQVLVSCIEAASHMPGGFSSSQMAVIQKSFERAGRPLPTSVR